MPRQSQRQPPAGNYSTAAKNLRNFAEGRNIVPQGIITDPQQNVHNVEHIIKYLHSNAFDRKIQAMIDASISAIPEATATETSTTVENSFNPARINQEIQNLWAAIRSINPEITQPEPDPDPDPDEPDDPDPTDP
jgi:hypothetical protein